MKAICFTKHHSPPVLSKMKVPFPHGFDPANNVVIKVFASSVSKADKMLIEGDLKTTRPCLYFPHVAGYDVSGRVEVGDAEGKFEVGTPVMAHLFPDMEEAGGKVPWFRGGMAEYCVARTEDLVRKPPDISFEAAAAIPAAGMIALQALRRGGAKEGDRVFITGGAGGVGTLAIQLAKHLFKASFVATTASHGHKTAMCKRLGADDVVNYKVEDFERVYTFEGRKFNVCIDTTDEAVRLATITKKGGKICSIADWAVRGPQQGSVRSSVLDFFGAHDATPTAYEAALEAGADWEFTPLTRSEEDMQCLATQIGNGILEPVLDNMWDFRRDGPGGWENAFSKQFSGKCAGKSVVRVIKST